MPYYSTPSEVEAIRTVLASGGDVRSLDHGNRTRLHTAARDADLAVVQLLVDYGADVHAQTADGVEPLHDAVLLSCDNAALESAARVEIIQTLLSVGANLESKTNTGDTPLAFAYSFDSPSVVVCLLQNGADPTAVGKKGLRTPEFVARLVREANGAEVVASFLKAGMDVNARDEHGDTLLNRAAWLGHSSAVIALLQAGADPNIGGRRGFCPAHFIPQLLNSPILEETPSVLEALVKAGANLDLPSDEKKTPLYRAAELGSPTAILWLVSAGANANTRDFRGYTPLRFASDLIAFPRGSEALKALVDSGLDATAAHRGETSLTHAAAAGSPAAIIWLLRAGANPQAVDRRNRSPLHFASTLIEHADGPEALSMLVGAGVDLDGQDADRETPLFRAAQAGSPAAVLWLLRAGANHHTRGFLQAPRAVDEIDVIEALISTGADADATNLNQATPLHHAASLGLASAVQVLLKMGANANPLDGRGRTSLHTAVESLKPDAATVIAALLEGGANINAEDDEGQTPVQLGLALCSPSALHTLLERGAKVSLALFAGGLSC
ncbi:hypothetical protein BOTBODRAFT_114190 [Botryobasidium botryosum FD-172 SS1]|uniref:Uncharacterized protein n=1 Tax=Botryobasidium botryosum (strain FD-172 SS1) TaxID=930990 RepID=A0A067MA72_BOTB1|nr:hypothetical protein BOTBODRAFT_114190 [Botryobasidium botryosum FD-172 SS1]